MRRLRPATRDHLAALASVEALLRVARDDAQRADCPRLVVAIRHALKSADGAKRHVERRQAATPEI